ncbi:MAG: sigma-70 family RNA polymerase sigma factor [Deltaproteobacteria bacterium]|nr:sigma-70 family RNA polymerase sigma factor [Deltaproteobacteria bacterium]NNG47975.1 sigma-70 family RNA polymerase sigma factor [Deltaproteobacteria bacterium]
MEEKIPPPVVEAARNGDAGALAQICERLYPRIYRYVSYKVDDLRDAEDLAGEVFVRMLGAIQGQKGNLEAWLFRIAGNVLMDHYRKRAVRSGEVELPEEIAGGIDPEAAVERKLDGDRLRKGLQALTEEQRETVILRLVMGYEHDEVAAIMGRSTGAIRALQFRALAALRDALEKRL